MDNIIQGAVIQIVERRPVEQQEGALEALYQFLGQQQHKVLMAKLKVRESLPEPDDQTPGESAVEE